MIDRENCILVNFYHNLVVDTINKNRNNGTFSQAGNKQPPSISQVINCNEFVIVMKLKQNNAMSRS